VDYLHVLKMTRDNLPSSVFAL